MPSLNSQGQKNNKENLSTKKEGNKLRKKERAEEKKDGNKTNRTRKEKKRRGEER